MSSRDEGAGCRPAFVSVDWGSSALRVVLAGAAGTVLDRRTSDAGIRSVPDGDFATALRALVGDWIAAHGPLPIVASGMIGSRNGWREVPYRPCPAAIADLADGLVAVPASGGLLLHLVPGVSCDLPGDIPDVMRGEECQVVGALAAAGRDGARLVLPGTHSKWVTVERGRIVAFSTVMTGEIYGALRHHTILGALAAAGPDGRDADDPAAFDAGVRAAGGRSGEAGLGHIAFGARSLVLFDRLAPASVASWLSGALIGAEIGAALGSGGVLEADGPVEIVGEPALAARYLRACESRGVSARLAPPDVVVLGHLAIARHLVM